MIVEALDSDGVNNLSATLPPIIKEEQTMETKLIAKVLAAVLTNYSYVDVIYRKDTAVSCTFFELYSRMLLMLCQLIKAMSLPSQQLLLDRQERLWDILSKCAMVLLGAPRGPILKLSNSSRLYDAWLVELVQRAVQLRALHTWKHRMRALITKQGDDASSKNPLLRPLWPYYLVLQRRLKASNTGQNNNESHRKRDSFLASFLKRWRLIAACRTEYHRPNSYFRTWRLLLRERLIASRKKKALLKGLRLAILSRAYGQLRSGQRKRAALLKWSYETHKALLKDRNAFLFKKMRITKRCLGRWRDRCTLDVDLMRVARGYDDKVTLKGAILRWKQARFTRRTKKRAIQKWHKQTKLLMLQSRIADTFFAVLAMRKLRECVEVNSGKRELEHVALKEMLAKKSTIMERRLLKHWRHKHAAQSKTEAAVDKWCRERILRKAFCQEWYGACRLSNQARDYHLFKLAKNTFAEYTKSHQFAQLTFSFSINRSGFIFCCHHITI